MKLALYVFYGTLSIVGATAVLAWACMPEFRQCVRFCLLTEW